LPSQSSTPPNTPSPLTGSEYLFPSEPQSPEQAPASPPEHASTRGIPPTSRPDSPDSPNYDDLYRAFGDLSPLTPPPSALATTRRRQRALMSPPTTQPVLLAPTAQPVPPAPAAQPALPVPAAQPAPPVPPAQPVLPAPVPPVPPAPPLRPRIMAEAVPLFYGD